MFAEEKQRAGEKAKKRQQSPESEQQLSGGSDAGMKAKAKVVKQTAGDESGEESGGHNKDVKYVQYISKNRKKQLNQKKRVFVQFDKDDLEELVSENGTTRYRLSDGTTQASTQKPILKSDKMPYQDQPSSL